MARRRAKSKGGPALRWLGAIALLALAVAVAWHFGGRHLRELLHGKVPVGADAHQIESANEDVRVKITGLLATGAPLRDPQLGVSAHAAVLWRKVEMLQWQEHCSGADCSYDKTWSAAPIDSHKFRHPAGHENPPQRLAEAKFEANDIKLGAYGVDAALLEDQLKAADLPAHANELPPNLAASFSERDGVLYAGGDPAHPDVGTVRVSYRVLPLSTVTLEGVQKGKRLTY